MSDYNTEGKITVVFGENDEYQREFKNLESFNQAHFTDWSNWAIQNDIPSSALKEDISIYRESTDGNHLIWGEDPDKAPENNTAQDRGFVIDSPSGGSLGQFLANPPTLSISPNMDPGFSMNSEGATAEPRDYSVDAIVKTVNVIPPSEWNPESPVSDNKKSLEAKERDNPHSDSDPAGTQNQQGLFDFSNFGDFSDFSFQNILQAIFSLFTKFTGQQTPDSKDKPPGSAPNTENTDGGDNDAINNSPSNEPGNENLIGVDRDGDGQVDILIDPNTPMGIDVDGDGDIDIKTVPDNATPTVTVPTNNAAPIEVAPDDAPGGLSQVKGITSQFFAAVTNEVTELARDAKLDGVGNIIDELSALPESLGRLGSLTADFGEALLHEGLDSLETLKRDGIKAGEPNSSGPENAEHGSVAVMNSETGEVTNPSAYATADATFKP